MKGPTRYKLPGETPRGKFPTKEHIMDYETNLITRIGTAAGLIKADLQTMEPLFYFACLEAILPEFSDYVTVEATNQLDKVKKDILENSAFEFIKFGKERFSKAFEIFDSYCVNYIEKAMAVSLGAATILGDDESPLGYMLIAIIGKCYYALDLLGNPETKAQTNMRVNLFIRENLI